MVDTLEASKKIKPELKVGDDTAGSLSFIIDSKGNPSRTDGTGCYGGLIDMPPKCGAVVSVIQAGTPEYNETTLQEKDDYLSYCVYGSPFKHAFTEPDVSMMLDLGLAPFNTHVASNIMMLGMFSVRQIWSKPHRIKIFNGLVEAGVEPNMAFLLSEGVCAGSGLYKFGSGYSSHTVIDLIRMGKHDCNNFLTCDVQRHVPNFYINPLYKSVHTCFMSGTKLSHSHESDSLQLFIGRKFSVVAKEEVAANPFAVKSVTPSKDTDKYATYDDMITALVSFSKELSKAIKES